MIEPVGKEAEWTYAPAELRVATGTTVTFVNRGKAGSQILRIVIRSIPYVPGNASVIVAG